MVNANTDSTKCCLKQNAGSHRTQITQNIATCKLWLHELLNNESTGNTNPNNTSTENTNINTGQ